LIRPEVFAVPTAEGRRSLIPTLTVTPLAIADILLVEAKKSADERGFFSETYNRAAFMAHGIDADFVQDNHSFSAARNVVRGLHFQIPPAAQAKLVRVVKGAILDVAIDIRHGSPTFGRHVSATISADAWNQIFIPEGFAHGFCTLEPNTEVIYKASARYSPEKDRGIRWNDPALSIVWPVDSSNAILSVRDEAHPRLSDIPAYFTYDAKSAR
jgi:dTDP-4-dehydrorhamnose 3,5-epimerase